MRICSRCGEQRELVDFPERKLGTGRRHGHCRACKAAYQKAWYEKNKDRHKRNVEQLRVERRRQNRALLRAAKSRPCADCGGLFPPYVMDFDHVRGTKGGNISRMVASATRATLEVEIAKCDVVCANCHRERTYATPTSAWHRRLDE